MPTGIELLTRAKILAGVPEEDLEAAVHLCETVPLKEGDRILSAGEPAKFFYVVLEGRVALRAPITIFMVQKEILLHVVGQGELLGWSAIVHPHVLTLSAVGLSDGQLLRIPGEQFLEVCNQNHRLGHLFMQNLSAAVSHRLNLFKDMWLKELERSIRLV